MFLIILRRIFVIALLAASLWFGASRLFMLMKGWNPQAAETNEVSIWENHLHSVKQELPVGVDHVGYLAEWDFPDHQLPPGLERTGYTTEWDLPVAYRDIDALNEFRLTKYVLAPIIVDRGSNYNWIIGNFSQQKFKPWLHDTIGSYEIKEIGWGIYLIHRIQK